MGFIENGDLTKAPRAEWSRDERCGAYNITLDQTDSTLMSSPQLMDVLQLCHFSTLLLPVMLHCVSLVFVAIVLLGLLFSSLWQVLPATSQRADQNKIEQRESRRPTKISSISSCTAREPVIFH